MNAAKHTPGPWHTDDTQRGDTKRYVCSEHAPFPHDVCAVKLDRPYAEANARLIAAAPDLLEALEELLSAPQLQGNDIGGSLLLRIAKARSAIAKATGGEV